MAWGRSRAYIYKRFVAEDGEEVIACIGEFDAPYGCLLFFKDVASFNKCSYEEGIMGRLDALIGRLRVQDIIEIVAKRDKFKRDMKP